MSTFCLFKFVIPILLFLRCFTVALLLSTRMLSTANWQLATGNGELRFPARSADTLAN